MVCSGSCITAVFLWDMLYWEGEHGDDRQGSLQGGQFVARVKYPTEKTNPADVNQEQMTQSSLRTREITERPPLGFKLKPQSQTNLRYNVLLRCLVDDDAFLCHPSLRLQIMSKV